MDKDVQGVADKGDAFDAYLAARYADVDAPEVVA